MAACDVVRTNSNSKTVHSQVPKHGLAEFLLASRPEVEARRTGYWLVTAATIRCTMPSIAAP